VLSSGLRSFFSFSTFQTHQAAQLFDSLLVSTLPSHLIPLLCFFAAALFPSRQRADALPAVRGSFSLEQEEKGTCLQSFSAWRNPQALTFHES